MAACTVLSVNGCSGRELAKDHETHLHGINVDRDAARLALGSKGRDGIDAPSALPGEPAENFAVEILRSRCREGGMTIRLLGQLKNTKKPLPEATEILPHNNVHFAAVGGSGEPGRHGGPGTPGAVGQDGTDATRDSDATDGAEGGDGGAGGRGSDGGSGGPGGRILIYVDEDQTELLHAVTWDVSGGKGGEPGQHGEPGEGGRGGPGGKAAVWEAISHYNYHCTPYCVGGNTDVALLPNRQDWTMEMFRRVMEDTGRDSILSNTVATVSSAANRVNRRPNIGMGACRCKGGSTHCPGCEEKPVYRTFSRPSGRDGTAGARGAKRREPLFEGSPGADGSVEITVRHSNGHRSKYSSVFKLQLARFDIEDGNADGIFEPGEDIYIRRIQVRNNGGMPSPLSVIPCQLISSDLIQGGIGADCHAPLPTSVPAGGLKFSDGEIRGSIQMPSITSRSLPPYTKEERVCLRAVLPWLKEPLADFNLSSVIKVQFPLEFRHIKRPTSLAPRFASTVRWEVFNKSGRAFGPNPNDARVAKVLIMVDSSQGEMLNADGNWVSSLELTVPNIHPREFAEMSQRIRVKPDAAAYSHLALSFQLFISTPKHGTLPPDPSTSTLQLIESHKASIQVAPGHIPSEDDDVLIVTNPGTKMAELDAIKQWLETELSLKTNVWNVGIYGGLLTQDPRDDDVMESILPAYAGKLVIFLGNQFPFCEGETASVLKICDPESLQEACAEETSCLFFGLNDDPACHLVLDTLLRPILDDAMAMTQSLPDAVRFKRQRDLLNSLQQTWSEGYKYHLLEVRKSKLRKDASNLAHAAQKLSRELREKIPHAHFIICMIAPEARNDEVAGGHLLVWRGLARTSHLEATTAELFTMNNPISTVNLTSEDLHRRPSQIRRRPATLTPHDRFRILAAVPVSRRLNILRREQTRPLGAETARLVELSIVSQIDDEIQTFLAETRWPNSVDVQEGRLLKDSLPSVFQLISGAATEPLVSPIMSRIIAYCLASSRPQSTRQAFSQAILPFGHRRKQLFSRIAKMVDETLANGRSVRPTRLWNKRQSISIDSITDEQPALNLSGRRVSSSLATVVNEVTGRSRHFQERARYGVREALDCNDVFDLNEWQLHVERSREHKAEVLQLFNRFQDERERYGPMVQDVNPPAGSVGGERDI